MVSLPEAELEKLCRLVASELASSGSDVVPSSFIDNLVGKILENHPEETWPLMDDWLEDECMWIRRTALIAQLRFKEKTDVAWLLEACEALMHEKEFFIRKAIGWALRELSRVEPEVVREWTDANKENLSGLSYREERYRLEK